MNHYIRLSILFIFALFATLEAFGHERTHSQDAINYLEKSISMRQEHNQAKLRKIESLKQQLKREGSPEKQFAIINNIFDEYRYFQYDSAFFYAEMSQKVAERIGRQDYTIESMMDMAVSLVTSGLFKEASDLIRKIDTSDMSTEVKQKYLALNSKLYFDMADYNQQNKKYADEYIAIGIAYSDSILSMLPQDSKEYLDHLGQKQMKEGKYIEAQKTFKALLGLTVLTAHDKAIGHANLGQIAVLTNDSDAAIHHFAYSASYDIESATRENTAMGQLAKLMYDAGDLKKANQYIKIALEDANYYNAQHRKVAIGYILPYIEEGRFELVSDQNNRLTGLVILVSILFILLLGSTIIISRQIKKLKTAQKTIELDNKTLLITNQKLQEANLIKDEYIGSSFFNISKNIEHMEELFHSITKKLDERHYDEVRKMLKNSTIIKERQDMYANFDTTFLKLFPDFVASYNKLFKPEDQVHLTNTDELTPELRIFALIRLGVTKSEQIANFLNYSVHTINTYKTKTKNKSIVDNKDFENIIATIGTPLNNPKLKI